MACRDDNPSYLYLNGGGFFMLNLEIRNGEQRVVSAREFYIGLGLDKSHWARWSKKNIVEDDFFIEGADYWGFAIEANGNKIQDFIITLDFAKHIAMMARTEKSHEYRNYLIRIEKAWIDTRFRVGDKKHQLECMELLCDMLPEEMKKDKVNYIKANTVVNKTVSNIYGFPKMLKKIDMNKQMLECRESVLNDYVKLFDVLNDNGLVKDALYKKYDNRLLEARD